MKEEYRNIRKSNLINSLFNWRIIRDENGTEIFRTDRFRFLYYDTVFYIMISFSNFAKHKNLSFSIGFATIFNHFLYSLIAKM